MTIHPGPRPVKLVRYTRRTWANGEDKHYYHVTVPNAIAETVAAGTNFYPIRLNDGSILFKRWDHEDFVRWISEGTDIPDNPIAFVQWLGAHIDKPGG